MNVVVVEVRSEDEADDGFPDFDDDDDDDDYCRNHFRTECCRCCWRYLDKVHYCYYLGL
jgi:hypothetical protein